MPVNACLQPLLALILQSVAFKPLRKKRVQRDVVMVATLRQQQPNLLSDSLLKVTATAETSQPEMR